MRAALRGAGLTVGKDGERLGGEPLEQAEHRRDGRECRLVRRVLDRPRRVRGEVVRAVDAARVDEQAGEPASVSARLSMSGSVHARRGVATGFHRVLEPLDGVPDVEGPGHGDELGPLGRAGRPSSPYARAASSARRPRIRGSCRCGRGRRTSSRRRPRPGGRRTRRPRAPSRRRRARTRPGHGPAVGAGDLRAGLAVHGTQREGGGRRGPRNPSATCRRASRRRRSMPAASETSVWMSVKLTPTAGAISESTC